MSTADAKSLADRIMTEKGVIGLLAVVLMGWVLWMFTTVISELADNSKRQIEILEELKENDKETLAVSKQRLQVRERQVAATEKLANAMEKIHTEKR